MSEKDMEAQATASEGQEKPNPVISKAQPESSPADLDATLDALADRFEPKLQEMARSIFQSEKDKGIAKASKTAKEALEGMNDVRGVVEKFRTYVDRYGSEEAALAEMDRDQRIEEALKKTSQPEQKSSLGAEKKPWGVRQKEILEGAGLDETDPRAVELAKSKEWNSYDEYLDALNAKSFNWRNEDLNKPKPSASTIAQTSKGEQAKVRKFDDMSSDELGEKMMILQKNYSVNKSEIQAIEQELVRRENAG